jgi:hypothetical protein
LTSARRIVQSLILSTLGLPLTYRGNDAQTHQGGYSSAASEKACLSPHCDRMRPA